MSELRPDATKQLNLNGSFAETEPQNFCGNTQDPNSQIILEKVQRWGHCTS